MTHLTARLIASLVTLTTIVAPFVDREPSPAPTARPVRDPAIRVSAEPTISVDGGTADSVAALEKALAGFRGAGLQLPDLVISFSDDEADCGGHKGLFRSSAAPWQISICSDGDAVYEHELAHAWERANLTDAQRAGFMEMRGHAHWSGSEVPWNERGVEGVAFVVQQGLSDVPLSPALSDEARSRMQAYEFLTGTPAPRLVRWLTNRAVACPDRPTALSLQIPDATGATCA
jgi:hypothetical protein